MARLPEPRIRRAGDSPPGAHPGPVAQIVMYGVDDLLARACVKPGTVGAAAPTDFGHDDQIMG